MPLNPDAYRAFLAGENLETEAENAIIHSVINIFEGLLDREEQAIAAQMKRRAEIEVDSKTARHRIGFDDQQNNTNRIATDDKEAP